MTDQQRRKNRLFIVLIFGMAIIPVLLAWVMGGQSTIYCWQDEQGAAYCSGGAD